MSDTSASYSSRTQSLKYIGPGLCMAGAAIGVSHIMQSTRAGANYGFHLLTFVLLANFFKYCAFESGHRYAAATGESLIEAYRKLGRWQLWAFECVCVVTGIGSIAAVSYVTGALAWVDVWRCAGYRDLELYHDGRMLNFAPGGPLQLVE